MGIFQKRLNQLIKEHLRLIERKNEIVQPGNGIFDRYKYPVLTSEHTPIFWRYDLDEKTNPYLMECIGVNSVFN
ncbi:MAG: glycosidase, partial [Clostridiaceae bacterium]|nr:glycosidase [Clostridiaceae bacterium]